MKLKQRLVSILLSASIIAGFPLSSATVFALDYNKENPQSNAKADESVVAAVTDAINTPEKAVEIINKIDDKITYEEALRTVLDKYYLSGDAENIKTVAENADSRGESIIENYKEASTERQTDAEKLGYMPGEILAVVKSGIDEKNIPKLLEDGRTDVVAVSDYTDGKKLVKLSISLEDTVDNAVKKLEQNSVVEFVQKDYVYKSESIYAQELLEDEYADNLFHLNAVNAPDAWNFIEGVPHEKIKVGIIDTGAQIDHPDLKNIINKDLSVRISCDGIIAPLKGDNGIHGTHVSGIVAAQANNEIGVAGVASAVNNDLVELVEIGSDTGTGSNLSAFVIYKAILYAIDNNVRVINMSLGGATDPDNIFQSAIDLATKSGCVVVCAAGNESSSDYAYPSDCSGAISVIALDENCTDRADYSNYGGTDNKVCAPGTAILSTLPESYGEYNFKRGYEKLSGTSMATPVVAAEAAMILSVSPNLTGQAVKDIIYSTCTDMGTDGYDRDYGYGSIDISKAVKKAYETAVDDMPTAVSLSDSSVTIMKGDSHKVTSKVKTSGDNNSVYYHIEDSGIAKVGQDGTITGVACGETKLVVSTENSITAECVVRVKSSGKETLAAPYGNSIQTGAYTGARINWSKIQNADFYQIYSTTGDSNNYSYIGSTTLTSYAASMGLSGSEVPAASVTKYKIKAVSNSSQYTDSGFSNEFVYIYVGQEPYLSADQLLEKGKDTGLLIHWSAIVRGHLYRTSALDGEKKLLANFDEDMKTHYYEDTDLVNGVTYTYTLQLYTEYNGREYSEISTDLVVDYSDDDPLDPSLGTCMMGDVKFENNTPYIKCVTGNGRYVSQCLASDNDGKSWFTAYNLIGDGSYYTHLDGFEFGKTYLVKVKSFDNEISGLYRRRSYYSQTLTVKMPDPIEGVNLNAERVSSSSAYLTWNESEQADYYIVYRRNQGTWQTLYSQVYGEECFDNSVSDGNIYYYKVVPVKKNPEFTAVDELDRSHIDTVAPQLGNESNIAKLNTNNENTKYFACVTVDDIPEQSYTGSEICPKVNAYYDGELLTEGVDYYVDYLSNTASGKGYAVLVGIGTYSGKRCVPFYIADKTEIKTYTVTYKDFDGSVISSQSVKEGEVPKNIQPPYREGYVFDGWDKTVGEVNSDITVTAKYVPDNKVCNVAFLDKDGNVINRQVVPYGKSAAAPEIKNYDGYKFVEWSESIEHITKSVLIKPVYIAEKFAGGNGTEKSPYLISNAEQLRLFSSLVNSSKSYAGASYKLTADIRYNNLANCSKWANDNVNNEENRPNNIWTPAGTAEIPFSGSFDGGGHTISGLYIFTADDYAGFLGYAKNADITSLKLDTIYVNTQKGYAGALAGKFENTSSTSCKIHACAVENSGIYANGIAGGMIGELESTFANGNTEITDCYSKDCHVVSMWDRIVGGLIGSLNSAGGSILLNYTYTYNSISASGNGDVTGGMVIGGFDTTYENNAWCSIKNCYFSNYNFGYKFPLPIYNYEELTENQGAYTFENIVGMENDDETDAGRYTFKPYDEEQSNTSDYVWMFNAGKTPSLYFEKPSYSLKYYLDDELISEKYYHEGDAVENPQRYYTNGYISTNWEYSFPDFDGVMPGYDVTATAEKYMCGDVDCNGEVNINDTTIIQKYLADMGKFGNTEIIASDVNGDGAVDVSDCTELQEYISAYKDSLKGQEIPDSQIYYHEPIIKYVTITVKDGTAEKWLHNSNADFAIVDNATGVSYQMLYADGMWTAEIPETVSSVTIQRKSPTTAKVWNSWTTEIGGTQFTVTGNSGGYWKSQNEDVTVTLADSTSSKWLSNDNAVFDVVDNDTLQAYDMEYVGGKWTVTLPSSTENITIRRKSPKTGEVWNTWKTTVAGTTFTVTGSGGSWS